MPNIYDRIQKYSPAPDSPIKEEVASPGVSEAPVEQPIPPADKLLSSPPPEGVEEGVKGVEEGFSYDEPLPTSKLMQLNYKPLEEVVGKRPGEVSYTKEQKEIADAIKKQTDTINSAMEVYKREKDGLKSREMWESIVNAVGMIAAGWHGLNKGRDMSGVKFSKKDWESKLATLDRELRSEIAAGKAKYDLTTEDIRARKADKDKQWSRNMRLWDNAASEERERRQLDVRKASTEDSMNMTEYGRDRSEAFQEYMYNKRKDDRELEEGKIKKSKKAELNAKNMKRFGSIYKASVNDIDRIIKDDKAEVDEKMARVAEAVYKNAIAQGIQIDKEKAGKAAFDVFQKNGKFIIWNVTKDKSPKEQYDAINNYVLELLRNAPVK